MVIRSNSVRAAAFLFFSATLTACATQDPNAASLPDQTIEQVQTSVAQVKLAPDAPFASEIYTFTMWDQQYPPTRCRTVFVGSSSIRFWFSMESDFSALNPLNRGFGGSQITNVISYFDYILTPHAPREIIFYAGENDISAGSEPREVVQRFQSFMELKTDRLGDTPVYFLSIKPSIARFSELATQTDVNDRIEDYARARDDLYYIDVATPMMDGPNPKPIFVSDQLHMNPDGYAIWTEVLSEALNKPDRPRSKGC